ncbi:MAG: hypothetical protein FH748_16990 [Balneolaceae bacterium]|nr:hypothetical protein [Balneolaceae bacterium]
MALLNGAIAALFFVKGTQQGVSVLSGALLSSIFVLSSAWILDHFKNAESRLFIKVFFISMGVRFLLVLVLFIFLVGATKIDEIYFTVSFIISYLYQSVTEMIFLNKILQKSDTRKK